MATVIADFRNELDELLNDAPKDFDWSGTGDAAATLFHVGVTNVTPASQAVTIATVAKTEGTHYTFDDRTGTINFAGGSSPHGAPANGAALTCKGTFEQWYQTAKDDAINQGIVAAARVNPNSAIYTLTRDITNVSITASEYLYDLPAGITEEFQVRTVGIQQATSGALSDKYTQTTRYKLQAGGANTLQILFDDQHPTSRKVAIEYVSEKAIASYAQREIRVVIFYAASVLLAGSHVWRSKERDLTLATKLPDESAERVASSQSPATYFRQLFLAELKMVGRPYPVKPRRYAYT